MAAEDMPPPLDDMTATLEQAKKLRGLRLGAQELSTGTCNRAGNKTVAGNSATTKDLPATVTPKPHSPTQPSAAASAPEKVKSAKPTPSAKSGSGDFGGMQKGFLFGGSKSSGKQQGKTETEKKMTGSGKADPSAQAEALPFIKPKTEDKNSGLKLDEVQEAMESTKGFLQDKEWVTDNLLEKVAKNETLSKRLGDPRFMQAVTEFQTNPKEAMMKYQNNPEMQQFLKEFCGTLGEHFTSLGEKEDSQNASQAQTPSNATRTGPRITELTDEDSSQESASALGDPYVQQILADPANREILTDPRIQQLIQHLRGSPEKAQKMLHEGDSDFRQKVDRLISLGLLKFQG